MARRKRPNRRKAPASDSPSFTAASPAPSPSHLQETRPSQPPQAATKDSDKATTVSHCASGEVADALSPARAAATPIHRPPASFATLPDESKLWILKLADADKLMLRNVGGTCRAWYTVCQPLRWQTVDLKYSSFQKLVSFVWDVLPAHAAHVRSLIYDGATSQDLQFNRCSYLWGAEDEKESLMRQTVEEICGEDIGAGAAIRMRARNLLVAMIIRACPRLEALELYERDLTGDYTLHEAEIDAALFPVLEALRSVIGSLTVLKLDVSPISAPTVAQLVRRAVNLRELQLHQVYRKFPEPVGLVHPAISRLRNIQVLDLDYTIPKNVGDRPFLSPVKRLTIEHTARDYKPFTPLLLFLPKFASTLEHLHLHSHFEVMEDTTYARYPSAFPALSSLASALPPASDSPPPFLPNLTSLTLDLDPKYEPSYGSYMESFQDREKRRAARAARIERERAGVQTFLDAFSSSPLTHITLRNFPIHNEDYGNRNTIDLDLLFAFLAHHQRHSLRSVRVELDDSLSWPVPRAVRKWCRQNAIKHSVAENRSSRYTGCSTCDAHLPPRRGW